MRWTGDTTAGDWLKPLIDERWGPSMHGVVPRRFEAYARVFHPATRDRPVGRSWPPSPHEQHAREWEQFQAQQPEIDTERVTWAQVAQAFGTTMHPLAQWASLVRTPHDGQPSEGPWDSAGWRYQQPAEGELDAGILSLLAAVLAQHTATPDSGGAALWEGWGGLLGGVGTNGRGFFSLGGDPVEPGRDFLARSTRDVLNEVFLKGTWQDGILSREISEGPRLRLPGRDHVLFAGGIREFAARDWELRMPWRDREAEQHGFEPSAHSPSIVWPDDHAWVIVCEVDFDSTIVAGSRALIDAVCAAPGVEASPIPADAALTWDSDEVNR